MTRIYLSQSIWAFLLECSAAMALSYSLLACFYIAPAIQYGPIPAIIVAVCMVAAFACAANRRFMKIGIPLYAAALAISWVISAAMSEGSPFVDSETNAMIYVMVCTLGATAAFLLARTRVGSAMLFMVGVAVLSTVQFLYEQNNLAWLIVFVVSALGIIIYKNFLLSVRSVDSVRGANFFAGFTTAILAPAISVGLAALVWFAAIEPLDPGAFEIKLISETRSLEMVLAKGVSGVYMTPDTSLTSDITNDDARTTDDIKEDPGGTPTPANGVAVSGNTKNPNNAGSFLGENIDSLDDMFDLANYDLRTYVALAIVIAALVGMILYFVFRRQNRVFRLMWMQKAGPAGEVGLIYGAIMQKFAKLGIKPAEGQTLTDFAKANEEHLRHFNMASNESFEDITCSYVRFVYGSIPLDRTELSKLERFYISFWKGAFKHLGPVKYFFKSFRL